MYQDILRYICIHTCLHPSIPISFSSTPCEALGPEPSPGPTACIKRCSSLLGLHSCGEKMKCRGTQNATGSVSEGGKLSGDELSRMEQDKEERWGAPPDRWTGDPAVLAVRGRVRGWGKEASLRG